MFMGTVLKQSLRNTFPDLLASDLSHVLLLIIFKLCLSSLLYKCLAFHFWEEQGVRRGNEGGRLGCTVQQAHSLGPSLLSGQGVRDVLTDTAKPSLTGSSFFLLMW